VNFLLVGYPVFSQNFIKAISLLVPFSGTNYLLMLFLSVAVELQVIEHFKTSLT
jgi:hypothetical protein